MSVFRSVSFVRGESYGHVSRAPPSTSDSPSGSLTGETAKKFYDEIIAQTTTAGSCASPIAKPSLRARKPRVKNCETAVVRQAARPSQLFRAAQCNDVAEIERCLDAGINVNSADMFGWTPLMSAAFEGAVDAVRFLLTRGADRRQTNRQRKTAMDLARDRGHIAVVQHLCKREEVEDVPSDVASPRTEQDGFCAVCDRRLSAAELKNHDASIVHQLNSRGMNSTTTHYGISEANSGFQMLLAMGWDPDRGIGPRGSGRKFPVKTVLKRDREGLDVGDAKRARVTHFGAHDRCAVENVRRQQTRQNPVLKSSRKRESQREADRWKWKEIEFRRQFH